jgi:3-oxoacyl-[acyl-carrier protein] reductase
MRFQGQTAIVSGGAGGLGSPIVRRLASEGAHTFIFDVDEEEAQDAADELIAEGLTVSWKQVDVTSEDSVRNGIEAVAAETGRLDITVNSAGIIGPNNVKIVDISAESFDTTLAVNLRGSFLMAKYSVIEMVKRNYGRICLIASIAGKEGNAGQAPYSTSKAGVIGLTKSIGKEYAETCITVNAVAPAAVWTPMLQNADPAAVKYMTDRIPMKRFGEPEEIAALVAFIVSPEATFNTGFTFDATGGRATY